MRTCGRRLPSPSPPSISWGVADFLGGLKARQLPLLNVLLASQGTGLVLVGVYMLIRWDPAPGGDFAFWAALSGMAGAIGLAAFYRGLAVGNMGVVAPISSTAAVIPVVVGIASGDRPAGAPVRGPRAGAGRRRAGVARGGVGRHRARRRASRC